MSSSPAWLESPGPGRRVRGGWRPERPRGQALHERTRTPDEREPGALCLIAA